MIYDFVNFFSEFVGTDCFGPPYQTYSLRRVIMNQDTHEPILLFYSGAGTICGVPDSVYVRRLVKWARQEQLPFPKTLSNIIVDYVTGEFPGGMIGD